MRVGLIGTTRRVWGRCGVKVCQRIQRIFEHLRAGIEGAVYPTIADKVAAVEAILTELDADPERITSLTGWHWIIENLHHLPTDNAA